MPKDSGHNYSMDEHRLDTWKMPDGRQVVLVYPTGTLVQETFGPNAVLPLELRWYDPDGNLIEGEPGWFEKNKAFFDPIYEDVPEMFEEIEPGRKRFPSSRAAFAQRQHRLREEGRQRPWE